jgi:hypothetical protein
MVINNTQQALTFYYEEPNERQIKSRSSKDVVAGSLAQTLLASPKDQRFFMLSDVC